MDERIVKLARNLVNYSCKIEKGEKVLVHANGVEAMPLLRQIVKEVYAAGGLPFLHISDSRLVREQLLGMTEELAKVMAENDAALMSQMDAYIGVTSNLNASEFADVPSERMSLYQSFYHKPVHSEIRVPKTKWVILRYPTPSMAQAAGRSQEDFEDFFYQVCTLDYAKMSKAMDSLVELMNRTDRVRIVGPGTDLSFSIKDIPAIKCAGELNIPDGEVYTAPVKDSVNGTLHYNTPSEYLGFTFDNVCLEFKDGKIINATANDNKRINEVFDTDAGARYIGEFAIGVNPYVQRPMKNTLFDEKIMGSFHFTPGNAYDNADNTNRSAIHWDLVCIQTLEWGGGEIYFDDVLIRKDGIFVIDELICLNPNNLI